MLIRYHRRKRKFPNFLHFLSNLDFVSFFFSFPPLCRQRAREMGGCFVRNEEDSQLGGRGSDIAFRFYFSFLSADETEDQKKRNQKFLGVVAMRRNRDIGGERTPFFCLFMCFIMPLMPREPRLSTSQPLQDAQGVLVQEGDLAER